VDNRKQVDMYARAQLITPLSLGTMALVLAVATVLLIFKIRRGTPPTILDGVFRKLKQAQTSSCTPVC
jgi:hypothetical protein